VLEELQLLVRLQAVDTQLMDLDLERGDLPEQVETLGKELARLKDSIGEAEASILALSEQRKHQELVIETSRDRLKKSQNTLYSVKTTREYDAISSEIEQAKHAIADAEKMIIELNARSETARRILDVSRGKLASIQEEYDEKQADMREQLEFSKDEELKLHHEREKIVVRLKKPILAHYERIRKIREGTAVSHLSDGACSYCFARVPPQRQAEIRRMDDLILCEVCGCVIVSG